MAFPLIPGAELALDAHSRDGRVKTEKGIFLRVIARVCLPAAFVKRRAGLPCSSPLTCSHGEACASSCVPRTLGGAASY